MPDDETATAVAEPPVGPTVPVAPEPQVVPDKPEGVERELPEGEQAEPEPEGEAELPETEAGIDALLDQLGELFTSDPKLAERIFEKLPQELRDRYQGPEAERARWDRERGQQERKQALSAASMYGLQYAEQNIRPKWEEWASSVSADMQAVANAVAEGKDGAHVSQIALDSRQIADTVVGIARGAQMAGSIYAQTQLLNSLHDALEDSAAHEYLSTDDRKALAETKTLLPDQAAAKLIGVYIGAALRSSAQHQTKQEQEKKTKAEGDIDKLAQLLKTAGVKKKTPTSGPSKTERTDAELLADPTTPVAVLMEIRRRQKAGQ